jgi:pimeloyl-ACP methyl ester carboxylesterase
MKLVPLLTDPAAHGGDAADAFTVVAPSLPGYTLSFRPNQARRAIPQIGAMFHELMLRLGYTRYGAQGGDWGSFVTAWLGANRAQSLRGIHLNMMPIRLHRRVVLAVLRPDAWAVADRREDRRADRLLRVSARDPAPAARGGRARVHRHPALERDAEGRALRRSRAARGARAGDPGVFRARSLSSARLIVISIDE